MQKNNTFFLLFEVWPAPHGNSQIYPVGIYNDMSLMLEEKQELEKIENKKQSVNYHYIYRQLRVEA